MNQSGRKLWWGLAACVVTVSLVWRLTVLPDAHSRLGIMAAGFGQRLEILPLDPWEQEYFGKARARRWLASDQGSSMIVTVVDGSGNRRAVHDPAFCFRGAGWTVGEETKVGLAHGEATRVVLQRGTEEMEAIYWYSDGRRGHGSPITYWLDTTIRRLSLGRSGAEPVLILIVPAQGRGPNWGEWLSRWPVLTRI